MKALIFVVIVALPVHAAKIYATSERAGSVTMIDGATIKTIAVGTRGRLRRKAACRPATDRRVL